MRYIFLFTWLLHNFCAALTIEEKVGQLMIVHFNGSEVNEVARTYIQELHVGGIIYYTWANGLENPDQVQRLSAGLQGLAKIPLWIAVDQEGGPVTRLGDGFYKLPSNREIAATGYPVFAYESAKQMGLEMKAVGINMNLAPVVDVSSDPMTSVMAGRTYGDTPEIVIEYASEAVRGYKEAGIVSVLKHFPGYGNVQADPHAKLSSNLNSIDNLESIDLKPFKNLSSIAPAIMTAHIKVPALDPDNCATLSKTIMTDLLRKEIGYQGLIITDSMVMQGLLDDCSDVAEASIRAIIAGCDLLILGGKDLHKEQSLELTLDQVRHIHRAIVDAVQKGRISITRLNESLDKILLAKDFFQ